MKSSIKHRKSTLIPDHVKPLNQQWYIQKKTEVVKGGLCSETVPAVVPTSVCHNKIARGSEIQCDVKVRRDHRASVVSRTTF